MSGWQGPAPRMGDRPGPVLHTVMMRIRMQGFRRVARAAGSCVVCACLMLGQENPAGRETERGGNPGGPPAFGRGGNSFGWGGPGGFGGVQEEVKLVKRFDVNGDKRLDAAERKAAREALAKGEVQGRRSRGPGRGGFRGRGEDGETAQPGPKLTPADVRSFPDEPLYDPLTLRTFFLEFENADWEKELADFKGTDVEVPARLTVDGQTYQDVGVHFRGQSSYMMVREGRKRSLNLSLDFVHKDQQIGGYRTLNLLNSHEDPTFLRAVLYYEIAREFFAAPRANFVRLVINGESWGIYVNVQQFNKDFARDWFGSIKGARWKVPGSPGGRGNLAYLGDEVEPYRKFYEIKSKDDAEAWGRFIRLCKILNETPPDQLEERLAPVLDIDGALQFLALENALINNDGYWVRCSDFDLCEDGQGRFHVIPHDANETFTRSGGMGFPGMGWRSGRSERDAAPKASGVELDPLVAAEDANKPLLSKLLAVPALRTRYLGYVQDIADKWLDWNRLGPIAKRYQTLITTDVRADTKKLYPVDEFLKGLTEDAEGDGARGGRLSLKTFADQRRAFLLNHPEVQKAVSALREAAKGAQAPKSWWIF